jgi:hypothetical protein
MFTKDKLDPIIHACSTAYVLRTTSAEFGLHAGKIKFNTESEE